MGPFQPRLFYDSIVASSLEFLYRDQFDPRQIPHCFAAFGASPCVSLQHQLVPHITPSSRDALTDCMCFPYGGAEPTCVLPRRQLKINSCVRVRQGRNERQKAALLPAPSSSVPCDMQLQL